MSRSASTKSKSFALPIRAPRNGLAFGRETFIYRRFHGLLRRIEAETLIFRPFSLTRKLEGRRVNICDKSHTVVVNITNLTEIYDISMMQMNRRL